MRKARDSRHPTRRDLDRLVEKIGPHLARRFSERGIGAEEAGALTRDALLQLAYRWNEIRDRERWLRQTLERAAEERPAPSQKETGDGGT